jgi:hypothetical protein
MEEDLMNIPTAEQSALDAPSDEAIRIPYYCEENVWRLAVRKQQHASPMDRFWVVFITNIIQKVPMFQQKAADTGDVSVCWDYHVILLGHQICSGDPVAMVYDVDSRLPYPCPLDTYLSHSFPYDAPYPFAPMFRIVPMQDFLTQFTSDRSHMRDVQGNWQAPPPFYAPIMTSGTSSGTNLQDYLRLDYSAHTNRAKSSRMMGDQSTADTTSTINRGIVLTLAGLASVDLTSLP